MKVKAKTPHKTQSREPVAAKHVAHLVQTFMQLMVGAVIQDSDMLIPLAGMTLTRVIWADCSR
ncbi:hypothetical protein C5167_020996 [Papaver somniferum]|uniref:Uncharacterized protein n=1 Tax=Papaver somniferum TaxID=3469 RepID=A0A4Y7IWP9_PAPSO|nr:hypothetical protein C5167_020996 [Papaver somniferum]